MPGGELQSHSYSVSNVFTPGDETRNQSVNEPRSPSSTAESVPSATSLVAVTSIFSSEKWGFTSA